MFVSISPYLSVSRFMGYLKGKSSLMIFDRHAKYMFVSVILFYFRGLGETAEKFV